MVEVIEIIKLLLKASITLSQIAGLTEEEQKKLYNKEFEKFKNNTPDKLPKIS